ncbi:MAG: aminotransferase class V-fold PLP-dependent enzyme, partial [Cyanobacteria bacterium P01_F01_bin.143]
QVTRPEQLPLSYAQKRLWFLTQLEPDNPFYNIPAAVRLQGKLDLQALEASFNQIIARHETLRTNFLAEKGAAVAVINEAKKLTIPFVDLSSLTAAQQSAKIPEVTATEAGQPFDIETDQLIRVKIFKLDVEEHVVVLTMHHIISDGWSIDVLIRELSTTYQACTQGEGAQLPELPIQYVDFAIWQQQWLQGETLEKQKNYWLKQLENAPQVLELPTDHPRPAVQTFQGASYPFELDQELTTALKRLSQQQGSTLFMTLLAAFKILLGRYSSSEDIVVGTPIANRNRAEIENLIGFFVNTLVLRTNLEGNPSFEELLQRVKEVALGAYAHQDFPFEKLVEEIQPERDLSYNPLFGVMFILQNAPTSEIELPGLTLNYLEEDSDSSKFDLTLTITETDSGLEGSLEYNTDIFEKSTIERIVHHWQTLLSGIVANPQQRLSELPLLTESEQQLLSEWNNTAVDYPQNLCLHQLFEQQVEQRPDDIALIEENQRLSYRQLNQLANQLAHHLRSQGVSNGVLVGICVEPSLAQIVSLLGVLKANGVYVPLDPSYPTERLSYMVENSQIHILLTQESHQLLSSKITSPQTQIIYLDRDRELIDQESDVNLNCQVTLNDPAYGIYTSGSTGKPKAVMGKIRGIVNRLRWMEDMLPFEANEVCVQKTSINFVDHVAEIFAPLVAGIPLVIVPEQIRGDIPQLMNLLSEYKITRIVVVPSLLKAMLENEPQQLDKLRYLKYVFCSGEALPIKLTELFHQKLSSARLFNIYGSSEVAADVTCFEINFWETRQRILQYFKPEVVRGTRENQVQEISQKPFTKPGVSPEALAIKFQGSELPSSPVTVDDYYDKLSQEVLPYTIDTGSPTYIGHMTSALPDFMHDMSKMISRLNQNLVKIETSKSLIFLEREAIAILHRLVYNFSSEFYAENIQQKNRNLGIITTGGTTANISALLCARNSGLLYQESSGGLSQESLHQVLSRKGYQDIVIIGSRLMHYSLNKAASILGLGTDNILFIDSKSDGTLDLDLLQETIQEARKNKLYILALVGIAGTTETGQIDPLPEMGAIAQKFDIHFHIDAAWGGATIFSQRHKEKLRGIEQADSITICGHKQLYLPQGISVCLFKDPKLLNFAETTARYQAQRDTFDVGRFTIEGSRSAISLCLHSALHIIGKRGYEILINDGIEKAQYFSKLIELLDSFELIMKPTLNIVNYRYIPEELRAKAKQKSLSDADIARINQLNTKIQKKQFEQGLTFVSKTTLRASNNGKLQEIVVFRTVLSNPNTTVTDLHHVLEDQLRIVNQIKGQSKELISNGSGQIEATTVDQEARQLQLTDEPKPYFGEALEKYLQKNTIPIGRPIANTQMYILDKYGSLLPPGVTGELYVGGDGLAQGYLHLPELTQQKFVPNPFSVNSERLTVNSSNLSTLLYKTGDLGRWLPDGNIEFIGRVDHQVKLRGFRIELGEIAAVISQYPAVRENVVVVREDLVDSKSLVAYIVADEQKILDIELIRSFLGTKLPNYMIPSAFVILEKLPLTPNGKVDRKALPEPDISRTETEFISPRNATEKIIAEIYGEILKQDKISINDSFFILGGHSLLATQVLSRLRETFELELPLRIVFEKPTVVSLAEHIAATKAAIAKI